MKPFLIHQKAALLHPHMSKQHENIFVDSVKTNIILIKTVKLNKVLGKMNVYYL